MSRRTDAGWENLADKLPFQPCGGLQNDVLEDIYDNDMLGAGLMLYSRESVETSDSIMQTMRPEDWTRWEKSRKRHWGARCTCSNCGEEFFAGYVSDSGTSGIVLRQGEDGQIYDGYVDKGDDDAQIFFDDETIVCPRCYQSVVVTRRSELRQGRTLQALQAETLNIDGYLTVLYWMVARHQDNAGTDVVTFSPHAALIVDRCGVLRRFRAVRHSDEVRDVTWTPCKQSCDPMQQTYYCHGAVNGRQVGGWVCTYGPELGGTTGEKTALDKYIGAGGVWPGAYLHVWRKHPQVENLMRQGFDGAVTQTIDSYLNMCGNYSMLRDAPNIPWVDWSETKPHRMLGMSKEAFREVRGKHWSEGTVSPLRGRAPLADRAATAFRSGPPATAPAARAGNRVAAVHRLSAAFAFQDISPHALGADRSRRPDRRPAVFPCRSGRACRPPARIAARPPQEERELIDEGKTLRHCVGTYGRTHCSGKPIFFVRHYRRPERSYYTLNIDLTRAMPKEIQLHGYGNERHGERKQYEHGIPKKVRDFCDRWEREVLTPWFMEEQRKKFAETNKADKKARKGA